ncbi:MAG: type I DNA topoisomerase [bacterium]|nr:type I DNA topoisomerase [bacterium]
MNLVIVESPTKTKTISKYLGKNYTVKSSVGHIRDLPKNNKKAIDIEHEFKPRYEIIKGKEGIVSELKKLADKSDEVILATDPDREGEAIAWHIAEALGLKGKKIKRISFHEITQEAVEEALQHPRKIDENLRKAQEARRVLDRLVGYDLSGLIWKKVRYGLSAGRVQSPALRIIMEREREIRAFKPENYWTITADFKNDKKETLSLVCSKEPRSEKDVNEILEKGKKEGWSVIGVEEKETKRSPLPPFITSTLQQTASSRLGFSPSRTMYFAQRLYEAGHITYMRTDSLNMATKAIEEISKTILKKLGKNYLENRVYKTQSKNAQEAHEAVRPSNFSVESAGNTEEEEKLYKLIWKRAVASQMSDSKILKTKISANIKSKDIPDFTVTGSRTLFDGWLAVDPEASGKEIELPKTNEGDALALEKIESEKKETMPLSRYTEAGLVKELEKRGIGRPSTYATIIKTIQDRGYVEKIQKTLHPTDTGEVVSDFLEKNFGNIIADSFTAKMEDELDEIAAGKREYAKTLGDFYKPFSEQVKEKSSAEKITTLGEADKSIVCPECGGNMVIKLGRKGKFLSCSRFPDCAGARTIDGKAMEPPKETGEACPKCKEGKLIEREGKFGKFISCNRYPKCRYIKKDEAAEAAKRTNVTCPICKKGVLVEKRGRFGIFYGCSEYPNCKYIMKTKPTGNICKDCGSLMMEGTKTIPERCSNKICPNHNPHKIKS